MYKKVLLFASLFLAFAIVIYPYLGLYPQGGQWCSLQIAAPASTMVCLCLTMEFPDSVFTLASANSKFVK